MHADRGYDHDKYRRMAWATEATARDRYAIRDYASAAVKHGTNALTAIRDALAGNPWMPAIPDTA